VRAVSASARPTKRRIASGRPVALQSRHRIPRRQTAEV
jgi:hypothetical protein